MSPDGCGAVVESRVPGRVRFRLPRENRCENVISDIRSVLHGIKGVTDITTNVNTGSVLVKHDPNVIDNDELIRLARGAKIVTNIIEDVGQLEQVFWPGKSEVALSILGQMKRFDQSIGRVTGGIVDGKMVVVFLLLGMSMARAFFSNRAIPTPWHALLWYSYSMFMQWHRPGVNSH